MVFAPLALTLGVMAGPAEASVDVRWRGPTQCIDEAALVSSVLDLSGPPQGPVWLEATALGPDAWSVVVEYADTTRTVRADDCVVLTEAVALIVAVRVDALQTAVAVRPEPTPESAPEPEPEPVPEPAVVPEPTRAPEPRSAPPRRSAPERPVVETRRREPNTPTVLVGVGGSIGSLPRGGAALRADLGLRRRALELDLGALATLGPPSERIQAAQATFRVFAGLAQACWVLSSRAVEAPLCARAEVGVMQGRPQGLQSPSDRDGLWLAPGLRLGLAPRRGRFAPEGFLEVAAPLRQHRFVVDDDVLLHRLPPAVLRIGIALRWRGAV